MVLVKIERGGRRATAARKLRIGMSRDKAKATPGRRPTMSLVPSGGKRKRLKLARALSRPNVKAAARIQVIAQGADGNRVGEKAQIRLR